MPELPEVEVTKQSLEKILQPPLKLESIDFFRADLRDPIPKKLCKKAEGQILRGLSRRAKYLLFEFDELALISHLGMTGTWRLASENEALRTHDHLRLNFVDGKQLLYNDPRRFGVFEAGLRTKDGFVYKRFEHLGVEPLSAAFDANELRRKLASKNLPIKVAIMDQKVVVGVGNIYASEALFRAHIRPTRKASSLNSVELKNLVQAIRQVLKKSIQRGGSSISDFLSASEEKGYFQNTFSVYDREGEKCRVCEEVIRAKVLGGRSTFWCQGCQH